MRLIQEEIRGIKKVALEQLGPHARVWLYGARLDDNKRGGRIELLFEAPEVLPHRVKKLHKIYAELIYELEGADLDVQLKDPETPPDEYDQEALLHGIAL